MLGHMGHIKGLAILSLGHWTVTKGFYSLQCEKLWGAVGEGGESVGRF